VNARALLSLSQGVTPKLSTQRYAAAVRNFASVSSSSLVTYTKAGNVGVIGMDDGKMNSFSFEMMNQLNDKLDDIENDQDVKAVVLHGNEKCFSAGFDLGVMMGKDKNAVADMITEGCKIGLRLFEHRLPIVIGCTGHGLAMGAITLLASDLRIGPPKGTKAKIGLNEVAINVSPPIFMLEMARSKMTPEAMNTSILQAKIYPPEDALGKVGFLDELAPQDGSESVVEMAVRRAQEIADTVQQPSFRNAKLGMRKQSLVTIKGTLEEDMNQYRK